MQTLCVGFLVSQRPISHWFQRPLQSPPGIYLHLLIPSKAPRSKINFPDRFQQKWEENQCFSELHSKISTARPANQQTSFQANLCSSRVKSTRHVSTTNHVLGSDRSCVPGRAERDTPKMTPYAPEPYRISCVKPDSQGQLDGCWKNTKLAALISSLQGSVHHPPLAQVSADNFQLASAVYYCFCTYTLKSYFKAAQLSRHQI